MRKVPKDDKLDRLEVVGPSPITTSAVGEWAGSQSDAMIVNPAGEFGAPEILPMEAAVTFYNVEFEPDPAPTHIETARAPRAVRQLSAEEQFRAQAGTATRKTNRAKTVIGA